MKNKSVRKNNAGVSLVELLVVFAILSVALTGIFSLMTNVSKHYNKQSREISLHDELQTTFSFISDKIKAANKVSFSAGTLTITKGQTGAEKVEKITQEGDELYFYPSDGSSKELLTEYVKTFNVGPDSIKTYAVVSLDLKSMTEEASLEQNVFMRTAD